MKVKDKAEQQEDSREIIQALKSHLVESNQQLMSGIAESNRQQVLTGIATMVDTMHMLKGEVAAGQTRRCRTGRHRTHPSHRLRRGTGAGYLRRQADGTDLTKSGSQLEVGVRADENPARSHDGLLQVETSEPGPLPCRGGPCG